jgi:hypothetical protein
MKIEKKFLNIFEENIDKNFWHKVSNKKLSEEFIKKYRKHLDLLKVVKNNLEELSLGFIENLLKESIKNYNKDMSISYYKYSGEVNIYKYKGAALFSELGTYVFNRKDLETSFIHKLTELAIANKIDSLQFYQVIKRQVDSKDSFIIEKIKERVQRYDDEGLSDDTEFEKLSLLKMMAVNFELDLGYILENYDSFYKAFNYYYLRRGSQDRERIRFKGLDLRKKGNEELKLLMKLYK